MGRKKIEIEEDDVERLAADGLAEHQIAAALGISHATLARRKADSADFAESLKRGRRAAKGEIENVAYECAKKAKDDPRYQTALIFWLKTQAGWKERQVIETVDTDAAGESRDEIVRRICRLASGTGPGSSAARTSDADD